MGAMRRTLGLALVLCAATISAAHAVPVAGKEYSLRQPDGTFTQVRIWGDEYFQIVESLDGYTLLRDPKTQVICYAKLTSDGHDIESSGLRVGSKGLTKLGINPHIRPAQKIVEARVAEARALAAGRIKTAGSAKAAPKTGPVKGLCLIVDFYDQPGTIARSEVVNFCNQTGYTGFGNNGSVFDYYNSVSGGALQYTNVVTNHGTNGYYRVLHAKTYYDDPTVSNGPSAVELITEALNAMKGSIDFRQYDADGDGYVDALNCYYAGTTSSGWARGLWPHQGSMNWTDDGVTVGSYQISDMGTALALGTFCHENGHLIMGWPDLYDYDHDSYGVGQYCLMGYYASDTNPIEPCAPLKIVAGWATPAYLDSRQAGLSLTAGANTFFRYDNPDNSEECYVIENRQKSGRDASLNDSGLAVWHVDTHGSNDWNQRMPYHHYLVTLVQADGLWHLENEINYGDSNDLFSAPSAAHCGPTTNPNTNWWSGVPSDLDISGISASGTTMTFNFTPPNLRITPVVELGASGPVGGGFSPASGSYTLKNLGNASQNWTATADQPWLTVAPGGGSLAPNATVNVSAAFNSAAAALTSGVYKSSIVFTNTSTGESRVRSVRLRVGTVDDSTELFDSADNDLDNKTVTFTPSADGSMYFACRTSGIVSTFPSSTAGSTTAYLDDDDAVQVNLTGGQQVYLYGQAYSSLYIGSNGYVTFGAPDTTVYGSANSHFSLPRISGLFDDLDPSAGGTISYKQTADRMIVTYNGVPLYGTLLSNSFQLELFFDRTIRMTWLGIGDSLGVVGLSAGEGVPSGFVESDISAYATCGTATITSTLSSNAAATTRFSPIPVTVTFGESVTGFAANDIIATNAAVSDFTGSGASYSFNLSPTAQGTVSASIPAGAATGSGGKTTVAASISRIYDSLPPTISISAPTPAVTATGPVTYTVTYTGASNVTLSNADVMLVGNNATGTRNVTGTGSTRTVTISNITGNGSILFQIFAGTAVDAAGNVALAAGPSPAVTVDNSVIAVNIGPPSVISTRTGPVTYTVRYDNVATVSLTAARVTLNRTGTANAAVAVSAAKAGSTLYRLVTLSNITGQGTLGISIAAGTARDAASRTAPAAGPSATFVVDTVPPTLTILGDVFMILEQNSVYVEEGAKAYDAVDGDLTGAVAVDFSRVHPSQVGTYTVTYTVHDAAGNVTTRNRTVAVMAAGDAKLPLAAWPVAAALIAAAGIALRRRKKA